MTKDSTTGHSKTPSTRHSTLALGTKSERVQKIIANAGFCSRRNAEELIKLGRVFVNGKKAQLGDKASASDTILIDGEPLEKGEDIYIALNKPENYLSTTHDPGRRKTVIDLLPEELKTAKPAGRLDYNSEGLIILSTDGDFINHLTHPKFPQKKVYQVTIKEEAQDEKLEEMASGEMELEGYKLNPMEYKIIERTKKYTKLLITLSEGRKRQIREVLKLLGYHVVYLRRVQVGSINLGDLPKGEFRHLTAQEIESVLK